MASRSFYFQVILRVVFITLTSVGIAFLALYSLILFSLIIGLLLFIQCVWLIQYINRTNAKIAFFFESVKNEDFSLKFSDDIPEKSFRELNQRINEVNLLIQQIFLENRAQEAYFREVLKQIDVGILGYDERGHILFANRMIK
ncbi:MAG: histidine kinase, partial [Bacteroidota bacterium]